ncbi:MAG: hypothetical protein HYY06_11060 [Deltaproteobacteria bacterium]|nr:hypothetical protein [Deltaproteobacteria bacterium]
MTWFWKGSIVLVALSMATPGCVVRGRATIPTVQARVVVPAPPPPPAVRVSVAPPQLAGGVSVVAHQCAAGAQEVFNGFDDNCDGRIDEGFVGSGSIQITLWWQTGADIDMYVKDPAQETVSYSHRTSGSGGQLDRDARGACTNNETTENVFWNSPNPPSGMYQVEAHYYSQCNNAGPTPIVLSISVGGAVIGAYQYTLQPEERVTMATFNIP